MAAVAPSPDMGRVTLAESYESYKYPPGTYIIGTPRLTGYPPSHICLRPCAALVHPAGSGATARRPFPMARYLRPFPCQRPVPIRDRRGSRQAAEEADALATDILSRQFSVFTGFLPHI